MVRTHTFCLSDIMVRACNCAIRNIVKRGRDWEWGNQDHQNGKPSIGHVTLCEGLAGKGWARVRWNGGESNRYRIAAEGSHDLYLLITGTSFTTS